MSIILRTEYLTKKFGELVAVNNITLSIEDTGILSIIGPNGAGKTTFFNLITGYYKPTSGKIYFLDNDITNIPSYEIVRKGLARSFQIASYFPDFTVFENIQLGVLNYAGYGFKYLINANSIKNINDKAEEFLELLEIKKEKNLKAKYLSHGYKKLLDIAMSLTLEPKILLLDEPTSGVSGEARNRVIEFIKKLSEKLKVVIIEHDMDIVFSISDRIVVLAEGAILADGTREKIKNNEKVINAYLGKEK
jgi:branched-chain amino acid transport system ATP-binding protein